MNEYDFPNKMITIDISYKDVEEENRELNFIEKVFGRRKTDYEIIIEEAVSKLSEELARDIDNQIIKQLMGEQMKGCGL